tara:strand:+ start:2296 stop:2544 length:249 start_codon:yes stop_codon:yes gene_type:complete
MSSEVHKYIEEALDKKKNLFNAEVINFPNDKKIDDENNSKMMANNNVWKISDNNNVDQLRAVTGICLMFVTLILIGLYSNFF